MGLREHGSERARLGWPGRVKERFRPYYLKLLYFQLGQRNRPDYFRDCWSYPNYPLDTDLRGLMRHDERLPDLLFFPMTDWHTRIQRTQHLARTLGHLGHRCFYVSPHLGREFPQPYPLSPRSRVSLIAPQVAELHVHLPSEPVYHHRPLRFAESERVCAVTGAMLDGFAASDVIQVVSFPIWMEVARQLRDSHGFPILYDCHDLLGGFASVGESIVQSEAEHLRASDLVVFSSDYLEAEVLRELPELRDRSVVVRNAVEPDDFLPATRPTPRARPTVGYVGALEFWFDTAAVRLAAERHPEWDFLLVGRVECEQVRQLSCLLNVRLAGEVPYAELPRYYAQMDVGLIPFTDCPLTRAANPIKLYEYFCCGLPVVSRHLPETELFADLVYLARDAEGFVRQLERAMREGTGRRAERQAVARRETWKDRCRVLRQSCAELLATTARR